MLVTSRTLTTCPANGPSQFCTVDSSNVPGFAAASATAASSPQAETTAQVETA